MKEPGSRDEFLKITAINLNSGKGVKLGRKILQEGAVSPGGEKQSAPLS